MSLRSKMQILEDNANSENATDSDILKAALVETQNKYSELSAKLTMDIEALRLSVEQSNEQKATEIQEALKTASETILSDLQGKISIYMQEVEAATKKLEKAKIEKEKESTLENIKIMAIVFAIILAAFYTALLLYGWWYDIPEAVGGITNHNTLLDAINNGIYQLLQR